VFVYLVRVLMLCLIVVLLGLRFVDYLLVGV